ncbi:hypothetical protein [Burkholderia sp. Nafp2/4-1b]|uniref:hypothetical protein n=1 Tax=Burkholderia sp. Nafp2/4-1b TaxID=2116686 RepID=UPI0013CEE816|nr:hypothetical protein [Burkholderia sp. Nafp2/4-1b]
MNITKWTICNFVKSQAIDETWMTAVDIAQGTSVDVKRVRLLIASLVNTGYLRRINSSPRLYQWADDAPPLPEPIPDRAPRLTHEEQEREIAEAAAQWAAAALHRMVSQGSLP